MWKIWKMQNIIRSLCSNIMNYENIASESWICKDANNCSIFEFDEREEEKVTPSNKLLSGFSFLFDHWENGLQKFVLFQRKGITYHEYITSWNKLNKASQKQSTSPSKESFFSKLDDV